MHVFLLLLLLVPSLVDASSPQNGPRRGGPKRTYCRLPMSIHYYESLRQSLAISRSTPITSSQVWWKAASSSPCVQPPARQIVTICESSSASCRSTRTGCGVSGCATVTSNTATCMTGAPTPTAVLLSCLSWDTQQTTHKMQVGGWGGYVLGCMLCVYVCVCWCAVHMCASKLFTVYNKHSIQSKKQYTITQYTINTAHHNIVHHSTTHLSLRRSFR